VLLVDLQMPERDGLEMIREARRRNSATAIIVISGTGDIQKAVQATRMGAMRYLEKPFSLQDLDEAVHLAAEGHSLRAQLARLSEEGLRLEGAGWVLVGASDAMKDIYRKVQMVSRSNQSTVLIQGESGTGKELVAKAIHAASTRADAPFVAINCGNIPSELLESEIFGHVRGAYTGATSSKKGLFEVADGGTFFLDEVPSISLEMQAKLLRVIQEREFRRLGGLENIKVDVRIIAATNSDLQTAVANGSFRDDLYYRLNVIVIKLPPLRERGEDIPLLAEHFCKKYCGENARDLCVFDPAAIQTLMDYGWPGNVRELENVVERAVVLCPGNTITAELFPRNVTAAPPRDANGFLEADLPLKEKVGNFEKALILDALAKTDWNQKKAAELLSVNPTTLSEKLKRLKIKPQ
jgi:DNA-binding NtrC family response regulator